MNNKYFTSEYSYTFKEKIKKMLLSTFLPFQNAAQIYNILLQPFNGAKYLFIGLFFIMLGIITFPITLYFALLEQDFGELITLFMPGLSFVAIGLAMLLTSPVTLLVQMPIRATFNLLHQGWGRIEDGYHIQRIIAEAENAIELDNKLDCIISIALLHKKFKLNLVLKHRLTDINIEEEEKRYELLDKDFVLGTLNVCSKASITATQNTHLLSYLSLFKTAKSHNKSDFINAEQSAKVFHI